MTDYNVYIWRQSASDKPGYVERHRVTGISDDMSFLEMLDVLNESLQIQGKEGVAFDHDCREGICGACSLVINGQAHGPETTTTCQLHMRSIQGTDIYIEPWRATAFPIIKDCIVDRTSFDRIIQAATPLMPTRIRLPRKTQKLRLTRPHALAVELASPHARTPQRCFLCLPRFPT